MRAGGGKGANVAVAAAREGADVVFVAAVGDDDEGAASVRELAGEGVDTRAIQELPGRPTGMAVICVDRAGENHIVVASGANMALAPEHVEAGLEGVRAGDVCVVNFEIPPATVAATAAAVAARGGGAAGQPLAGARPAARGPPGAADARGQRGGGAAAHR